MTAVQRSTLVPGAVVAVDGDGALYYAQYVGQHAEYGDVLWVLPEAFQGSPAAWSALPWARGYYAFYPLRASVRQGLTTIVGQAPLDGRAVPVALRRVGARSVEGAILTWMVSDGTTEDRREVLSDAERRLPIASIWNHAMLLHRLSEGWHPAAVG